MWREEGCCVSLNQTRKYTWVTLEDDLVDMVTWRWWVWSRGGGMDWREDRAGPRTV